MVDAVRIQNLCGKARHKTNEDAQGELVHLLKTGARLDTLRIYECPFCSTPDGQIFHVGNSLGALDEPVKRPIRRGLRRYLKDRVELD
jgi:hypothetical protein